MCMFREKYIATSKKYINNQHKIFIFKYYQYVPHEGH